MNKRPKRSPTDNGGEVDAIWIAEDGEVRCESQMFSCRSCQWQLLDSALIESTGAITDRTPPQLSAGSIKDVCIPHLDALNFILPIGA